MSWGSLRIWIVAAISTALLVMVGHRFGPIGVVIGGFLAVLGVGAFGVWVGWGIALDHAAEEEFRQERHTHRKGDPAPGVLVALPHSGRLAVEPDPDDWRFFGESEQGWAAEAAEYELLHQPEPEPEPELTDTGEMRALTDERIAKMQGDSNEWIFTHVIGAVDG